MISLSIVRRGMRLQLMHLNPILVQVDRGFDGSSSGSLDCLPEVC
jgi:hypothetical protein